MTGFASGKGSFEAHSWSWDLRAVNGKGQDIRVRVPDWITGLEAHVRSATAAATARGNITIGLRLAREDASAAIALNTAQLQAVLAAMAEVEQQAMDQGLSLAPSTASQVLGLRGILEQTTTEDDPAPLLAALKADFAPVLASFNEMRAAEGAALEKLIQAQLDDIERLTEAAAAATEARRTESEAAFRASLARVAEAVEVDETRIAQELALLAVKADISEELGRLHAHVAAARALVAQGGAVGRKLDFLAQEFNREANTLCSKAQMSALTSIGLDLKAVIDQMREQIQNVE
ncbi:YicC/YloC family endoribonuclease [Lentibacter sp.]|uniref:YicC/YloC family endoribonuclease n=1 Tax=Lentibacter sp. TaxID=2024994 RepID=UPI003F6A9536